MLEEKLLAAMRETNENFWRERNGEPRRNNALLDLIHEISMALSIRRFDE